MDEGSLDRGQEEVAGVRPGRGLALPGHEAPRAPHPGGVPRPGGGDRAPVGEVVRSEHVGQEEGVDETPRWPAYGPGPEADLEGQGEGGVARLEHDRKPA